MDESNELQHLQSNQYGGLEGKTALAKIEQVLKGVAQKIHHHHMKLVIGIC